MADAGKRSSAPGGTGQLRSFATAWERFVVALRRSQARNRDSGDRLSLSQWDLLRPLADDDALTVGKLAETAGIAPATATRVLDGLVRSGDVERIRPENDRRTVAVTLTAAGRERLERTRRWISARERRLFDRLAPGERGQAERLLRHLAEVVEEL